jgi:hypothetical protein
LQSHLNKGWPSANPTFSTIVVQKRGQIMRYVASVIALAGAVSLFSSNAWGVDVDVNSGVNVSVGGEHDVGFFEEHLAQHGKWLDVPEHGRVWQPSIVLTETDWRPYLNNGHWIWTDAGWYWESNYAWGWAPFHYGRWDYVDNYNWVWTPGETWAPAWVSWRQSDSHYGWAPLGASARFEAGAFVGGVEIRADLFNFVPTQSFLSIDLGRVAVSHRDAANVYKETKIVNNSYVYTDNRVINNGIPVKQVGLAVHQEIKAAPIVDAKSPEAKAAGDGKISAFRPAIKKSTVPAAHETTTKAVEPKSAEPATKSNESKPADTKTKPSDAKPDETKAKATEPKPAEPATKPSESKPVDTKAEPSDAKPAETKTKAIEPKPAEPKAKPTEAPKPNESKRTPGDNKAGEAKSKADDGKSSKLDEGK